MKKLHITVLLVCCLGTSFSCRAEQLNVYCDNWPGFCQADGKGFYIDLVNTIYQPHGYTIVPHIVPYKRASSTISRGGGDMMLGAYQDELHNVLTPKYPDSADDLTVMMLKKWGKHWRGESSLSGQRVLWPRGWSLEKYISVTMNWHEVDSYEMAIELLEKERYRYYLTVGVLHAANEPPGNIYRVLLRWIPTYPAFSKSERGEKLRRIWDQEMVSLLRSGELANIYRRHQLYEYYHTFINDMEKKAAD
ncbi:substrate-binding periplasmic protein [Aeromonas veronii]